ncbi:MAG: hypothetical protein ACP5N1_04740 [Candidatus Woesearchaeota archaeon]
MESIDDIEYKLIVNNAQEAKYLDYYLSLFITDYKLTVREVQGIPNNVKRYDTAYAFTEKIYPDREVDNHKKNRIYICPSEYNYLDISGRDGKEIKVKNITVNETTINLEENIIVTIYSKRLSDAEIAEIQGR